MARSFSAPAQYRAARRWPILAARPDPEDALDTPVAKTAWYCCGVRAMDARQPRPLCGDRYAERFMAGEGERVFAPFADQAGPNAASVVRHRVIDDLLRERLQRTPDALVVLLGAGFDTRAFRLPGGRWVELDQPALLALKDRRLARGDCPNALERVAIDFAREPLRDKLAPWHGSRGALVVMEGVSMYLQPAELRATAAALRAALPGHTLVCDLIDATFERRYGAGMRRRIRALGSDFAPLLDAPRAFVQTLGYRCVRTVSVAVRCVELGAVKMPMWLLNTLLRSARDGYTVNVFEAPA